MVSLQKIDCSRFNEIYPLLESFDSKLSKDLWKTLFNYQWDRYSNYCGYGLFDDEVPVGYLGMLFSQRQINQQKHDFCNLTSWIVRPDYRSHSLSMMMPIMRLKDHTITDLSASETVIKLSERLGFQQLDETIRVLLPYPMGLGRGRDDTLTFHRDNEIAALQLDKYDQLIFEDHRPYDHCRQLVLQVNKHEYCHLLYTTNRHPILSYCHIQSISNISLFDHYQATIRNLISRETGIPLIVIDSRLVASGNFPFSIEIPLGRPRIYRSQKLQPAQIDNLYSEYILLGLRSLGLRKTLLDTFPMVRKLKDLRAKCSLQPAPSSS
jgi:hypothetical protein